MKELKITALVLCAAFLLVTAVSSGFTAAENIEGVNTAAAMTAFRPDTVMLSSGDMTITWDEFYFYLHNTASQITYGFTDNLNWNEVSDTGETWAEMIIDYVINQTTYSLAYGIGIKETGTFLDVQELEHIQSLIDSMILESGGLDILEEDLRADGFLNLSVYERLLTQYMLQDKMPFVLYGDDLSGISDDAVADFAVRNGYMRAKHILLVFPSEYEGATTDEIETAKVEKLAKAEEILNSLNAHKNDADFDAYFETLLQENSEDPGSFSFPEGYLFQYFDMVPEFSSACDGLQPGQISGIVESSYGYHIIYRLPLDYDMVPYAVMYSGQYYTLRQLAVFEEFESLIGTWLDSLDVIHSKELDSLDIAKLFAWH